MLINLTKEIEESRDWSKVITGYEELMNYGTSQNLLQRNLFYLFKFVTDEDLEENMKNVTYHNGNKNGYCYAPELVSEYNRRQRYKLNHQYDGLERTISEINLNFRIKVSGKRDGKKYNKLVGVAGLIDILGIEYANKYIERAFNYKEDNIYCKLRSGLIVTFYSK